MFARFFIDRPVFATVISLAVVIFGGVAFIRLPIAQYPDVAPPTIQVTAFYPGASAQDVAETVATPIETEVNGVENMLYMSSTCGNDGSMSLTITFRVGTDLDTAQVLVQNRVAIAQPRLPEEARRQGITTKKSSPNILLVVNLISPDNSRSDLYLSNYATLEIKDALARNPGIGDVVLFGSRDYSLRVWLDPEQLASRNMNAGEVLKALREQNVQVAAGRIGQPPTPAGQDFQLTINTVGRLIDPKDFDDVIVKTGSNGEVTRLRDVARMELGAKSYDVETYLDGKPSVIVALFQRPGSNALGTATKIRAEMERLKQDFPPGVDYAIVYDTSKFIDESVESVYHTLIEAFLLVFLVVLVFLQDWRATILPMIDVPVSLIGTLGVMSLLGFSLNNLTLFGLVLAIGIVVDDAIVVVENVERWMTRGLDARAATIRAMEEVTGPILAITLVLSAVFIPTAFIAGISGQFYRQFALTIAASTMISALNAMTMTPSRTVQIFKNRKPGAHSHETEALPWWGLAALAGFAAIWFFSATLATRLGIVPPGANKDDLPLATLEKLWSLRVGIFLAAGALGWLAARPVNRGLAWFFRGFNWVFERVTNVYSRLVAMALRLCVVCLIVYGGLMGLTYLGFRAVPTGFIPEQDKGYGFVIAKLPDGASLERTQKLMEKVVAIASKTPGVAHTINIPGLSLLSSSNLPNAATMFLTFTPFSERVGQPGQSGPEIMNSLRGAFGGLEDGDVLAFGPPPVDGLGNTGGFKLQIEDRRALGFEALQAAVDNLIEKSATLPRIAGVQSSFRVAEPHLFLQIDRTKAKAAGVALNDVFDTLQNYLGSAYVNDFTLYGRNWQVTAQADAKFRLRREDVGNLKVRNADGDMVPLATLITVEDVTGPALVNRYQLYPSADLYGSLLPGTSSGQAIAAMDALAHRELPEGMRIEWTDLSFQEIEASQDIKTRLVLPLGLVFVFLVLAAQYESWSMPLAIILIVPMCLSAAIAGIWIAKMENNIFTQVGLLVLIGLASKNAILIVEFARKLQDQGRSARDAAVEACRLRLRPILMTSFAFILGVVPLVLARGAGSEMRRALGVAVFSGMLGVTLFGLFFTPTFYVVISWFTGDKPPAVPETPLPPPLPAEPTA